MNDRTRRILWRHVGLLLVLAIAGCASPEDGRPVGGGRGGDGGNYRGKPIHVPSKLDGSKAVPSLAPSTTAPGPSAPAHG